MSSLEEKKAELASLTRRLAEPQNASSGACWAIRVEAIDSDGRTWWVCDNGSISSWEHRAMFSERWRCGLVMDQQSRRRPERRFVRVRITRRATHTKSVTPKGSR